MSKGLEEAERLGSKVFEYPGKEHPRRRNSWCIDPDVSALLERLGIKRGLGLLEQSTESERHPRGKEIHPPSGALSAMKTQTLSHHAVFSF